MDIDGMHRTALGMMRANIAMARRGEHRRNYLVPHFISNPGDGKTEVMEDVARVLSGEGADVFCPGSPEASWGYLNADLETRDAGELAGMPWVVDGISVRCRPDWLPTEGMGILALDEVARAPLANLNMACTLVRDGRIGEHQLPPGWMIVAASNPASARAGANPLPAPLRNRMTHLWVNSSAERFAAWGARNGIDPMIIAYLRLRPQYHSKFSTADNAFPSSRAWAACSRLGMASLDGDLAAECLEGTVGAEAATDFAAFREAARDLPDIAQVLADPGRARLPQGLDCITITMQILAHRATRANFDNVVAYLLRVEEREFGSICVTDAVARDPSLALTGAYNRWNAETGSAFAGARPALARAA